MKLLPYLFAFLFASFFSLAQQPQIKPDWLVQASLYRNGGAMIVNDIAVADDGSTIAVGSFTNTVDFDPGKDTFNVLASGYSDIFIAKYSKEGKLVYVHHFGSNHISVGTAYGVAVDDDGNVYMTGNFNTTIDFDPGTGSSVLSGKSTEAFIASYDINGMFRYARKVTDTKGDAVRTQVAKSIAIDKQRNVYITGSFRYKADFDPGTGTHYLNAAGDRNIFFAKYDSNGNFLFAKSITGTGTDEANKIVLDKTGNMVLCGYFTSFFADFDPGADSAILQAKGQEDIFFAKYDKKGNYLFAKNIGGPKYDAANAVAIGTDNSIVITGHYAGNAVDFNPGKDTFFLRSSGRAYQCFVAKYDSSGNFAFAFSIGNETYEDDGNGIATNAANNIIVIGKFSGSDVDFDPGPAIYTLPVEKGQDNFIAGYTDAGTFVFAAGIGNTNYDKNYSYTHINCVKTDSLGNIFTGGDFADTLDVDPGTNVKNVYEPSLSLLLSKYNNNGKYIASFHADNYPYFVNTSSQVAASVVDEDGNVYIGGQFEGVYDFDPGPGVYALSSLPNSGFIAEYDKDHKLIFAKAIRYQPGANGIALDKNRNLYISGNLYVSAGHFFAKYTNKGSFVFAKEFHSGFNHINHATGIAVDKNKNIYVVGGFSSTQDFDPGENKHLLSSISYEDIFVSKYDSSGNYLFAYNIGAVNGTDNAATGIRLNSRGDIIVCGSIHGDGYDFDPSPGQFLLSSKKSTAGYIASYQNNGTFLGAIILTSNTTPEYIGISSLALDVSDNVYIAGYSGGQIDFNPGKDSAFIPAAEGLYFASYTSAGILRFVKGSAVKPYQGSAGITSIATDANKNIYIAGTFSTQQIDVDMGPDTAILINDNYNSHDGYYINTELFLSRYDSLGNYLYGYGFNGDSAAGGNYTTDIHVDVAGNIYFVGNGKTKIDFDPGADSVFLQPSSYFNDFFVVKYLPLTTGQKENKSVPVLVSKNMIKPDEKGRFSLYPNPAANYISITVNNIIQSSGTAQANVYDAKGTYVMMKQLAVVNHAVNTTMSVARLPKGTYFITVTTTQEQYKVSFIIP